jgi:hypothetical protein
LIMLSVAAVAGTDQFGTPYNAGFEFYDSAGAKYGTGPVMSVLAAPAPQCVSPSQVAVLSVTLRAGQQYWFEAVLDVLAQSANLIYLTMGGTCAPSAFNCWIKYESLYSATTGTALGVSRNQTGLSGSGSFGNNTGMNSGTPVSGNQYWVRLQGTITAGANGTLTVAQASSATAASFTVETGRLFAYPIPQ